MIRVLLVDDHKLVRTGVRRILEEAGDIEIAGEASTGEEAVEMTRTLVPDVVLMDVNMPGIGGLEATRKLLAHHSDLKVIVVSVHTSEPYPGRLLEAGAAGYLTKDCAADEIVAAVHKVHAGERYITADVARELALASVSGHKGGDSPFSSLSPREMQVVMMVTDGRSLQEISNKLCLSPKTISTYRSRLFGKLGVSNDVELVRLAIRYGIVDDDNALGKAT